jgi:hypothetical protein
MKLHRREFIKEVALGSAGLMLAKNSSSLLAQDQPPAKPKTNIGDAMKHARTANSMPGKFPGYVVQVDNAKAIANGAFQQVEISKMLESGMLKLTGAKDINSAWQEFISPEDVVGLKVNPVAGKELSTSLEITKSVVNQLLNAGISKKSIVIWDRREFQLYEAGFDETNFPGITIVGTESKDASGSFYDKDGKLYGENAIDKDWYYWADVEGKYDSETLPYMVNEGKYSYFTKIVTQRVTKIINMPILKNAGTSVTLCMKNLAYGSISNTGRLHKELWAETCAEVCAFSPLRDKTVLNIVDGIKGCFNGGPAANPEFITNFNTILLGTDPVAVDRIGYEIILNKRIAEKIQKEDNPKGRKYMDMAEGLGLGVADIKKIKLDKIVL